MTALEKRIGEALANEHAASASIVGLIAETEAAITAAEAEMKLHHERRLDIVADPQTEQQAAADAGLHVSRLTIALDRLQTHHDALLRAEVSAHWASRFEAVAKKRDAGVEKFKRLIALANEAAQILFDIAEVDEAVRAVNLAKPDRNADGDPETRYLQTVELAARGLRSFSRDEPSFTEATVLPGLWPPRKNSAAAVEMMMMAPAGGADWADRGARVEQERASERERMAKHYATLSREQSERQNREERENIARRAQ
jgi:hypothetical protein